MDLTELIEEVRGLRRDVHGIRQEIAHYKGFVAGAAWCCAALAGVVGFVWGMVFGS